MRPILRSLAPLGVFTVLLGVTVNATSIRPVRFANVTFQNASITEVADELAKPGRIVGSIDPKGFNVVVLPNAAKGRQISGHWDSVKASDLFKDIARQGDLRIRMDPYAVVLGPRGAGLLLKRGGANRIIGKPPSAVTSPVIRHVIFRDATISEIAEYLNRKMAELGGPDQRAVLSFDCKQITDLPAVTLTLWEVPISEVVLYVAEYTGMHVEWSDRGAVLKCGKKKKNAGR